MIPKAGFIPYTDYLILEFYKNGTFKRARNIYHLDEDSVVADSVMHALITKNLKTYCTEVLMPLDDGSK